MYPSDGSVPSYPNLASATGYGNTNPSLGVSAITGSSLYANYDHSNLSQTPLDLSSLTAGLPTSFSIPSTASSPVPSLPDAGIPPHGASFYARNPTLGLGYGLGPGATDPLLAGYNHLDPNGRLQYGITSASQSDGRNVHWDLGGMAPSMTLNAPQYSSLSALTNGRTNMGYEDYDDGASHSSYSSAHSAASMSPNSAASPGDHSTYATATTSLTTGTTGEVANEISAADLGAYTTPSVPISSGQWANTPIVTQSGPDPIEPFFKTARERNLVSTCLILLS